MINMFNVDIPLMYVATAFALIGAFTLSLVGFMRCSLDTYSGGFDMAIVVVVLALFPIDFDFPGIPADG